MDELDDVLQELENGGNPVKNSLRNEANNDAKIADRLLTIFKVTLLLGIVVLTVGIMSPAITAVVIGGVLLSVSASALTAGILRVRENRSFQRKSDNV